MKIAVIGKGTSGIISTLVCLLNEFEVEIFHDPNAPHISVGESTTPHIPEIVNAVFGHLSLEKLIDKNIVSLKKGIKFVDWGVGTTFSHSFTNNNDSFHFETSKFNPVMHFEFERIGVKYHGERVNDYKIVDNKIVINEKQYDFVINCTGWNNNPDYVYPFLETVNSAAIYTKDYVDPDIGSYTIHTATEDGWQFGLPFPKDNVTKYGYLYNRNYISEDEVRKKLNKDKLRMINWTPRYSRKLITNPYIANNGNSLFFAEPLQALSLLYYYHFAKLLCEYIKDKSYFSMNKVNHDYSSEVATYFYSLAYHYQFGCIYKDSKFWNDITEKSKNIISFLPQLEFDNLVDFIICAEKTKQKNFAKIGVFEPSDLKTLQCGFLNMTFEEIIRNKSEKSNLIL